MVIRTQIHTIEAYNKQVLAFMHMLSRLRVFIREPYDDRSPERDVLALLSHGKLPKSIQGDDRDVSMPLYWSNLRLKYVNLTSNINRKLSLQAYSLSAFQSLEQMLMAFWIDIARAHNVSPLEVVVVPRAFLSDRDVAIDTLMLPPGGVLGSAQLGELALVGAVRVHDQNISISSEVVTNPATLRLYAVKCASSSADPATFLRLPLSNHPGTYVPLVANLRISVDACTVSGLQFSM